MIKSPLKVSTQALIGSPLLLIKVARDLMKVHKDFMSKVDEFIRESKAFREDRARILKLPKGDKGDMPSKADIIELIQPLIPKTKDGYTPKKGVDYFDGEDGKSVDPFVIAQIATSLITKPKDGETPAINAIVEAVIGELKLDERFKKVDNDIASYRNQLAGKHYGKNTWARGGGGSSTTSGKSVATQYLLTAVAAGSDVTIALSQLANFATLDQIIAVYRNNVPQTLGVDFTKTATVVTILGADASEIYNITYSYT